QAANPLFADGRAMRPVVAGTVARGRLDTDTHRVRGKIDDAWVDAFPMPVTRERLERGRGRYDVFCAECHGLSGYGDGPIHRRAETLEESRWIPPTTFHDDTIRNQPVGQLFDTITNGIRTMPAYGPQIPVDDRWSIVAYMRALQRSQHASLDNVPAEEREKLEP
ncbi:MAG: cytochrome c, partial [Phycisphaerae bacterium]|nr:cytochrome c [Phycisphaerae bacterium]